MTQQPGSIRRRWSSRPPSARPADFPVVLLTPPYGPEDLRPVPPDLGDADRPGAILAVEVRRPTSDLHPLRTRVQELSARTSSCPVVVLLRIAPDEGGLVAAARLAPHGFRAVVPHGPGMSAALRER